MRYAFDLDGTLADTREAVRLAYVEALGGLEPPQNFFELTWREWLPMLTGVHAEEVHARKNELYIDKYVRRVVATPMMDVVHELARHRSDIRVLTSASADAALAVLGQIDNRSILATNVFADLTKKGKAEHLERMRLNGDVWDHVVYFDDSPSTVEYLKEHTRCTICLVRCP